MKPAKPTKDTLSHSYILQITLDLIDQKGLEHFTMRKLGQQMGVSPMAVYRYFPNQGALFDGLVERIWQQAFSYQPNDVSAKWQTQVVTLMKQFRQTLLLHPNILPLMSTHPVVTKKQFNFIEKILQNLQKNGLEIKTTTVFLINSLTVYTLGFVWAEAVEPQFGGQPNLELIQELQSHSPLMHDLLQSLQSGDYTSEQQFLLGIKAILRGWPTNKKAVI
ncbi:TetR/AcrR family transcriptional regulator C-terminal domain-containing protein [Bombilactobacillus bombi]|uniref:TetR/AcrR family transcriptional regulator C-terminal domain-containing protein n=1 Tax=Bombilactobacillus bombi TaxID=1303590 RepID=UPI0015E6077E|nr:TetR/AcrR family transcriptional regulator C-terminal domain-containing protein [Bombilactobacillus bombi]MBA1434733.1 TetR/AcrR family transcriptional regulator [Bombilactobacillus bombi]